MIVGPAPSLTPLQYAVAVLSSLDGNAAIIDAAGEVVAVNEAWTRFGCENGAALCSTGVGVNYLEACRGSAQHSEDAATVLKGLLSVLGGTAPIFRYDYKCDGPRTLRWFRLTVTRWHVQEGCVLVLHTDITEDRLPAETQSRTLKSVRAIVWNADAPSFRTTFMSGHIEDILGFPSSAWLSDPELWKKRLHPKDRDWVLEYIRKAVEEGRDHEFDYRVIAADGRTVWLHQVVNLVSDPGKPIHLAGISFDITELKDAQERLKILGGRILKAQDEERSHIARELHDDIGQRLALVSIDLARLESTKMESARSLRGAVTETKSQLSKITDDIRSLAHGLHSHVLDSRGLVSASDDFCRELSARRNIVINFRSEGVPTHAHNTINLGIFRVLQEALQNAVKHSGARTLEVALSGNSDFIELSVRDDGRGFDPKEAVTGRGLGLTGMEERMTLLGGELSIDARPAGGTTIRARVPLTPALEVDADVQIMKT